MKAKSIVVLRPDKLQAGATAIHIGATRTDACRIGSQWFDRDTHWTHGQSIDQVSLHRNRHQFSVGDTLHIEDPLEGDFGYVVITGIVMMDTAKFTQADFQELGFRDRDEYLADWGKVFEGRVWYFYVNRIDESDRL